MDPRKQKRLGPAPIASFEKSFEDSTAPAANGLPPMQRVALTITEASEEMMDSTGSSGGGGGGSVSGGADDGTDDTENPPTATTTLSDRKATPSRKQLQDIGGKRTTQPPPIKTNIAIVGGFVEPIKSATLHTPSTPRIELSRASSSSHHEEDSRDSSPENVFEQVGTGTLQETIGLGFREEGALELRSSTEELFFMDPEAKKEEQEKIQQQLQQARRSSPLIFKFDDHQTYLQQHQRKDSASSEVAALLCISGRTSRISSVGSQGSAVSRLSAISGVSRSPSPHRMLLETSFCGPKPLENVVDGGIVSAVEPPTAEILEQVLLSRKHDPTQAVFAEGIKIESSPQRKKAPPTTISNGEAKRKPTDLNRQSRQSSSKIAIQRGNRLTPSKSPGQLVVGTTPSGAEYIRINLKPDHMYEDKGIAANERVVEAPVPGARPVGHKKPISLSLGRNAVMDEKRLTPSSSPKPSRHSALAKETLGSRSPSPANVSASRKSSFCSLFKQKDSPDSPKDRVRSRSKSRDRSTPQSLNPTPSKQKSVLAIFKPKRAEGKSKSSSPIDPDFGRPGPSSKTDTPSSKMDTPLETFSGTSSRPSSRLRYYDTPPDGKAIHIPLHTPPEEKEARKLLEALETRPQSAPTPAPPPTIPASAPAPAPSTIPKQPPTPPTPAPASQLQLEPEKPPSVPATVSSPVQEKVEKVQRIENLDAIHTLPQDVDDKERTWSLEVHRHSSQDSQDTVLSDSSLPNNCSGRVSARTNLENVTESPVRENGIAAEVHHVPPEPETIAPHVQPIEDAAGREKRRLLFATRLGSGSQEQIFSTQFSLSKTESLSSQLSDQASITENSVHEHLQRKDTVIRRPDDTVITQKTIMTTRKTETLRKLRSVDDVIAPVSKSRSTSEEEKQSSTVVAVMMRKKEATKEECRRKSSRSASEEDDVATHRHSRYLENFDVRKKFHENVAARKSTTTAEMTKEEEIIRSTDDIPEAEAKNAQEPVPAPEEVSELKSSSSATALPPAHPHPVSHHHHLPSDRQSVASTDEPVESSESERDSEADPNRLKRHLPRHVVSAIEEHESTGLVSQDSFDDELPYIPTTLPEERAHGVALIPMKERVHMELKTCPLDRPRSTTPLNPSHLEEYCGIVTPDAGDPDHRPPVRGEKLRISLPRKDSTKEKAQKSKSPRRTSTSSGKSWFEFAEEAIRGPPPDGIKQISGAKLPDESQPPQAPTPTAQIALPNNRKPSGQWIDFENIPEKRKAPKKITTLPKDTLVDGKGVGVVVHYNYVKPEECQCECHEVERESAVTHKSIASVDLLNPTGEDLQPLLEPEPLDNIDPSDSSRDYSCYTDDESETPRSNRTQSEEFPLRGTHSPRSKKFPDNRYS